jgi:putative DNA primase/helicase
MPVPATLLYQDDNTHSVTAFAFLPEPVMKVKAGTKAVPDTAGLPERFTELLAGDEDLRRRWDGNTDGLADPSRNGLDMSLTSLLVKRGFNDVEITTIHKAFPHGKVVQDGREGAYITDMLTKARRDRTLSRTEPWFTAQRLIAERYTGVDGISLLRYWNGDSYLWHGGAYRMLDEQDIAAKVWSYLGGARHFVSKKKSEPFKPNRARAGDVLGALKAVAHLDSGVPNPGWMDGRCVLLFDPKDLLVLQNGMLHLPGRALLPHTPGLFVTTALPFAYEADADPPKQWLAFLKSLWGDDAESIETLQEIFGYCLTTDCSQQKIPLIVGPKRAGKGTIAKVLRGMIGDANYVGPTLSSLATQFGLEALIGKRLAIFSDVRLSGHTDQKNLADRLLSISGEDALTSDRKYKTAWTGALKTRLLMFSNELPKILDDSGALSSRFIILRLLHSFIGKEDTGLADRLLLELPAILNWALDGLERLNARGAFRQPTSALELVQELEKLSSPISAFIEDKCVVSPTVQVGCDQLYKVYELYCRYQEGWKTTPTSASFGASLRAVLPQLERKRFGPRGNQHWIYKGVGLAVGNTGMPDLAANTAEIVDLDAVRAKNRELLI